MTTTTKTFKIIAAAVARTLDNAPTGGTARERDAWTNGVTELVTRLTDDLKAENPRFRYDTFFAAAGLDKWGAVPGHAARMGDAPADNCDTPSDELADAIAQADHEIYNTESS